MYFSIHKTHTYVHRATRDTDRMESESVTSGSTYGLTCVGARDTGESKNPRYPIVMDQATPLAIIIMEEVTL